VADPDSVWDRIERLLEFPVDFPIKVMGRRVDGFADAVIGLVRTHQPDFDPATVEMRASSGGAWLSLTLAVRAHSRSELQALYEALARHPLVRVVL
jgi:putative lipoic acid-binding regulatory protein